MKKVVAIVAFSLFALTIQAQETATKEKAKKESAETKKENKKAKKECKAEGKKCCAKKAE